MTNPEHLESSSEFQVSSFEYEKPRPSKTASDGAPTFMRRVGQSRVLGGAPGYWTLPLSYRGGRPRLILRRVTVTRSTASRPEPNMIIVPGSGITEFP